MWFPVLKNGDRHLRYNPNDSSSLPKDEFGPTLLASLLLEFTYINLTLYKLNMRLSRVRSTHKNPVQQSAEEVPSFQHPPSRQTAHPATETESNRDAGPAWGAGAAGGGFSTADRGTGGERRALSGDGRRAGTVGTATGTATAAESAGPGRGNGLVALLGSEFTTGQGKKWEGDYPGLRRGTTR